jgi:DNA ligase (NAD+)
MPTHCPSCGTKLEKIETEVLLRCPNPRCFAKQRRNFYHFVSRTAFNIDGLGPKIIDKLIDAGLVSDPSDLFDLREGDIVVFEKGLPRKKPKAFVSGFAEKSAENLIKSIQDKLH